MMSSAHELVLDVQAPVTTGDGRRYRVTVVARAATDRHWNAWLEFVDLWSQDVLTTDIETHQRTAVGVRKAQNRTSSALRGRARIAGGHGSLPVRV